MKDEFKKMENSLAPSFATVFPHLTCPTVLEHI